MHLISYNRLLVIRALTNVVVVNKSRSVTPPAVLAEGGVQKSRLVTGAGVVNVEIEVRQGARWRSGSRNAIVKSPP